MEKNENPVCGSPQSTQSGVKAAVPEPLKQRVIKQYIAAALVAALTLACLLVLGGAGYLIGFFFSGYLIWMGWDIENRWRNGKILHKRVVCLKAQKLPLVQNKQVVVLKDITSEDGGGTKTYYIPSTGRDAAQFSERMILDVYVEASASAELLAWSAVDMQKD